MDFATSPFLAVVSEGTPFKFTNSHPQMRCALRITHMVASSAAPADGTAALPPSSLPTFVRITTLAAPGATVGTFTIAGFASSSASGAAAQHSTRSDLVSCSDIVSNCNVQLDVDEYTEVCVRGPKSVTLFGEMMTELVEADHADDSDAPLEVVGHSTSQRRGRRRGRDDDGSDDEATWMNEMFQLSRRR